MGKHIKNISSQLVGCFTLVPFFFWTPTFKIKFPEHCTFLKNALEMPHEILGCLKSQDNISYSPAYNFAFLQAEIKQRN